MKVTQVLSVFKGVGPLIGDMTVKDSNLPKRYIERAMRQVYWKNPRKPGYAWNKTMERRNFKFTMNRPWEMGFYQDNMPGSRFAKIYIEPIGEWMFFKGDRVEILEGPDKGKIGVINYIVQERNWVTVEGLNLKYIYDGKTDKFPGIMRATEQPLMVTTGVRLIDPSDEKQTECEWRYTEDDLKVRVSLRTQRIIPIPKMAEETPDYKTKSSYVDKDKDTASEHVVKLTFKPKLSTFEMDIMKAMGIEEDRVPVKTYWI